LDLGFLIDDIMSVVCFTFIFMTTLPIQRANIVVQSFLDSRLKYESLGPMIKFLAFLVQSYAKKVPNISGIS